MVYCSSTILIPIYLFIYIKPSVNHIFFTMGTHTTGARSDIIQVARVLDPPLRMHLVYIITLEYF